MTDKAALLRAYHAALSETRNPWDLQGAGETFWFTHGDRPEAATIIYSAHFARVHGYGSPAACDEALARALKETGT